MPFYNGIPTDLKATWHPELTGSPYTLTTYSNFFQDNAPLKAYVNPTADTWRSDLTASMYSSSTQLKGIKRGEMPLFPFSSSYSNQNVNIGGTTITKLWWKTSSGDVTMTRTSSSLTIGTSTFSASSFRDGVIPRFIYILAVGGGGGGGGTTGSSNGTGGGGGGIVGAVIDLTVYSSVTLRVGPGGVGGHKTVVNTNGITTAGYGGQGGATSVSNSSGYILTASAGYGGRDARYSTSGGSGGSATVNASSGVYCSTTKSGGNGGNEGSNGSGVGAITLKTSLKSVTYPTTGKYHCGIKTITRSGGTAGDSKSGGGGASLYNGGNGGISSTTQAKNHGSAGNGGGAGGGGARFYLGRYNRGGAGSAGSIYIFY